MSPPDRNPRWGNRLRSSWEIPTLAVGLLPGFVVLWMFLSSPVVPPGGDAAHHAFFVRDILSSQVSVIPYSQFPHGGSNFEYPPLFDLAAALLVAVSGAPILATLEAFAIAMAFVSPFAYWRFLRQFFTGGPFDVFLGTAFVSFSWFLLLKTVRDGSYGDLMAAGVLLPLWLSFLWDRRDFLAAGTAFAILLTHNLTALLTFGLLGALLVLWAYERRWGRVKRAVFAHVLVLALAAPVAWPVYVSYLLPVSSGTAGNFTPVDFPTYVILLTPILLALGVAGVFLLRKSTQGRFVGLWALSWFLLSRTSFASERIVREMTFPLAIGAAGFAIASRAELRKLPTSRSARLGSLLVAAVVGVAVLNGAIQIEASADPAQVHYLTPYQLKAYEWLADHANSTQGVLSIASADPYLPVYFPGSVFAVISQNRTGTLSIADQEINNALLNVLVDYRNLSGPNLLLSYGIQWILLSTPFAPPVFTDPNDLVLIEQVVSQPFAQNPGYISAYSVNQASGSTFVFQVKGTGP